MTPLQYVQQIAAAFIASPDELCELGEEGGDLYGVLVQACERLDFEPQEVIDSILEKGENAAPPDAEPDSYDALVRQLAEVQASREAIAATLGKAAAKIDALRARVAELEAAGAERIVRPEPMTLSELIGLAFFQAPDDSDEERMLEDALDSAVTREGTDTQSVLGRLVCKVALLAKRADAVGASR